ncbi:MAG: Clp protease ClpP [Methylomicrobium sp.]|nr:Clp protease ClpP [Methylomicrobium sp.]
MKSWYSIKNKGDAAVNLSIHDEIGLWGIGAGEFIRDLRSISAKTINLSVHSPGGSVIDGLAMHNALNQHPSSIFATVEGIAASAASFVLMAADRIYMPEDSFIMIHNALGGIIGEAEEIRTYADTVEKLQNSIINIYQKRTGVPVDEIKTMMNAETWMNASEAVEKGFADAVIGKIGAAALSTGFANHFKSMPFNDKNDIEITTERELEAYLRDSGTSRAISTKAVAFAKKLFQGDPEPPENEPDPLAELVAKLDKIKLPETLRETQP